MPVSICGADCAQCPSQAGCGGCAETGGRPFGRACLLAACCRDKAQDLCSQCGGVCGLKAPIIAEFNALGIPGLPEVTDLDALPGAYINLAYPLPGGQTAKMLEDGKVYLGNQLEAGGDRCYGLAADQDVLLVCTYGEGGSDPELILYKKRGY